MRLIPPRHAPSWLLTFLVGLTWLLSIGVGLAAPEAKNAMMVSIDPPGISAPPPYEMTLGVTVKHAEGPFTYEWDLNEDGITDSTEPTVKISATEVGTNRVSVLVRTESGAASSASVMNVAMNPLQQQESLGYRLAIWGCLLTTIIFFAFFLAEKPILGKIGTWAFIATYAAFTYSQGFRIADTGRLPNIHLYEVLQMFSWFAFGWCLWAGLRFKDARPMAYCTMLVGLVLLYISNFSTDMKDAGIIQPALQSYWRNIHVTAIILSYGGITAAYFASMAYLFRPNRLADHMSYKATLFAYPLLTAGIIMGGMWAEEAWGTYWSWDPKETSSLVIWLVLTAYLHTRMILGWSGVPSAMLSIAGFASMVFCFVGLNFMPGNSMHKYAGAGMGVNSWILLAGFLLFHVFIWVSQRPWAAKQEAAMREAELGDVSEAGVDPVTRKPMPGLGQARASSGAIRISLPPLPGSEKDSE